MMVAQAAVALVRDMGFEMSEQLTPRQMFCAPLISALIFGGGAAGIADIYVHVRDIVPLNGRDWEPNPLERRLARWHSSIARAISDFIKVGIFASHIIYRHKVILRKLFVQFVSQFYCVQNFINKKYRPCKNIWLVCSGNTKSILLKQ